MTIRTHHIFTAFSAGEWSPSLEGRVDLQDYNSSCKEITNCIVKPQGGVIGRGGFHYVAPAKYADKFCRMQGFSYSDLQNYMVEVGNLYMRFYTDCGRIEIGDGSELVTNGTFDAGIANWTNLSTGTGSIAWDTDHMNIAGGASGIGWAQQQITTVADKVYILKFKVVGNPVTLRIGSTTGNDDILEDTVYAVLDEQIVFLTAISTSTFIQFRNPNNNTSQLDNVSFQLSIAYEIETDYLEEDLDLLCFKQSGDDLYIVHPLYPPAKLTRNSATDWTWEYVDFIDGPYEDAINTPTITPSWTGPSVEKVANGGFDADASWVKGGNWTISGGTANKSAGGANNLSQNTTETGTEVYMVVWTLVSISGGDLTMSIGGTSGTARSSAGTYTEIVVAANTNDLTFTPSAAGVVCSIDNVSAVRLSTLTASAALFLSGHEGALWRVNHAAAWGWCIIEKVNSATSAYANVQTALGAGASTSHREGAWSDVNGYPRSLTFYEQRAVYAGSPEHPQNIWGSKTWKFDEFTPGTEEDSPYTLKSAESKEIRWIASGRGLLFGAINGAFLAQSGTDTPISPVSPPSITSQSTKGSAKIQPDKVGRAILFAQTSTKKIIELAYTYELDSYSDPDIAIRADHFFEDSEILEMVYQQDPHSVLWVLLLDGTLLGCTYDRLVKIVAWHSHPTDGFVESIGLTRYAGLDQLWASVYRVINGNPVRYIEYLDWDIHQDSALTYSGDETTLIRGLQHLEGKTVEIVGDRATRPPQVVPASGMLTIDPGAKEIVVGLGYTPTLITQRPEVPATGTSQGLPRRWNKIIARVIDTVGLKINGKQIPGRKPSDPMDEAPPPFSGDVDITNLGWDTDGYITIEQPYPLPVEIVCLTGTLVIGD